MKQEQIHAGGGGDTLNLGTLLFGQGFEGFQNYPRRQELGKHFGFWVCRMLEKVKRNPQAFKPVQFSGDHGVTIGPVCLQQNNVMFFKSSLHLGF